MKHTRTLAGIAVTCLATASLPAAITPAAGSAPTPSVTSLSRHTDATTGGLLLVVNGSGFTAGSRVWFGGTSATPSSIAPRQLTVRVPAHAAGTVDVQVRGTGGSSTATAATGFRYLPASSLRSALRPAPARRRVSAAAASAITDPGLRACIADALSIPTTATPTPDQLAQLGALNCQDRNISSLAGLEAASQLSELDLSRNRIADLTPVARLTGLRHLWLANNQVTTLPTMASSSLTVLDLRGNDIASIAGLAPLGQLTDLVLDDNRITSLAPLADKLALVSLQADYNRVSDLRPLAGLGALQQLSLWHDQVSDLYPLRPLTGLTQLNLSQNRVTSLVPLAGLRAMTQLNLASNQVQSVVPLAGLVRLSSLNLDQNQVRGVAPLAHMTQLDWLYLRQNQVADLSTLKAVPAASIEAQGQRISLPNARVLWWPLAVRDRTGATPRLGGASMAGAELQWRTGGRLQATFTNTTGTFTGTISQNVLPRTTEDFGDATGNRVADLYVSSGSSLVLRPGSGTGFGAASAVAGSWGGTSWLGRVHDVNGDHQSDLLRLDSAGRMWLYRVAGAATVSAPRQVGNGWRSMQLVTAAGRLRGGSTQYLLARSASDGGLYRYTVTATGLSGRTRIATAWRGIVGMFPLGDWNGDGRDDVAAVTSTGALRLYTGTAAGGLAGGPLVGTGWAGLRVASPGDLTGDGRLDVVTLDRSGKVVLHPTLRGRWGAPRTLATGWAVGQLLG